MEENEQLRVLMNGFRCALGPARRAWTARVCGLHAATKA